MADSSASVARTIPTVPFATVPLQWVGPMQLCGDVAGDGCAWVDVPLATYESPLWPSVNRGARVTAKSGGIRVTLVDQRMSRSVVFKAPDANQARQCCLELQQDLDSQNSWLKQTVTASSRFAQLMAIHSQQIGNLLYLRFELTTGDASGHNMVTHAAEQLMTAIANQYPSLQYGSISANVCTDKKVSAVNGLLGRGKNVVAEVIIPRRLVRRYLKTTPQRMVDLHVQKDLLGSIVAGSLRSANAHAANMLLAFYLATGQDAANIVEGSQVINHLEVVNQTETTESGDLYFSTTCPNLIVGSVGNGKDLPFVNEVLTHMGCRENRPAGENAARLAMIAAATVLCGELSLLAAQTNPGELMQSHLAMERGASK